MNPASLCFLKCGCWRREEGIKPRLHDCVTFTRRSLKAGTVLHLHQSSAIINQACVLQILRGVANGGALDAHDARQEFVRIGHGFALSPVVHHQKPSAQPLFDRVKRVATHGLHDLGQQGFRKADEKV